MFAALDEYDDCEADAHRMRMGVMATLVSSSSRGHREYIDRGREDGHQRLMDDYWSLNPTYNAHIFRRHFRMQLALFDRMMNDVVRADPFFAPKKDALNKVNYMVNNNIYNQCYYLADGIYPTWATFVKTISNPDTPKKCIFASKQGRIAKMWKDRLAFYKRDGLSCEDPAECIRHRYYVI
ncbi:unnamed protein product [Cuscuta europaea]|uniref:Uncharacterized protein n=1 Tax=Cuscuta europaea TaxID=41803 RepID=A0A9P0ZAQ2_CUSEU|nr:unnamed protein product [Cuscuta europaea]